MVALVSPFADFDEPVSPRDAGLVSLLLDELRGDRPPWAADGLCQEYREVDWFPQRGGSLEPAQAVCRRCLVRRECAEWAYARPDIVGVWGGTSAKARQDARGAGLTANDLVAVVDARKPAPAPRDNSPSTWETGPCRGCRGNLSRRDLEVGDGWCWACRPIVKLDPFDEPQPGDPEMRACSCCEDLTPVDELDRHGSYWCARCW